MTDVDAALYRDALLALGRSAREFAQAIVVAVERARRADADDPLAPIIASECRAVLQQAFATAPGIFPAFTEEGTHGLASDAADDVSGGQPSADQGG